MKRNRLSEKDRDGLWGEDGPYSQVNLIEQTRILGDGISRVFLVVEAEINPFTFEYVLAHRYEFIGDPSIQQLLDHAEYRGPQEGYLVCAGEEELIDKRSFDIAFGYREMTVKRILKMHELVIKDFGMKRNKHKGITIENHVLGDSSDKKYIWNEVSGQVLPIEEDESVWDSGSTVSSPAGEKNGKMRYFIVLALASGESLRRADIKYSALQIREATARFKVEIEKAEAGRGYMMFTVLIGTDVAPADFIEMCIKRSNGKFKLFKQDYFITNTSRPMGNQIIGFLNKLV